MSAHGVIIIACARAKCTSFCLSDKKLADVLSTVLTKKDVIIITFFNVPITITTITIPTLPSSFARHRYRHQYQHRHQDCHDDDDDDRDDDDDDDHHYHHHHYRRYRHHYHLSYPLMKWLHFFFLFFLQSFIFFFLKVPLKWVTRKEGETPLLQREQQPRINLSFFVFFSLFKLKQRKNMQFNK